MDSFVVMIILFTIGIAAKMDHLGDFYILLTTTNIVLSCINFGRNCHLQSTKYCNLQLNIYARLYNAPFTMLNIIHQFINPFVQSLLICHLSFNHHHCTLLNEILQSYILFVLCTMILHHEFIHGHGTLLHEDSYCNKLTVQS